MVRDPQLGSLLLVDEGSAGTTVLERAALTTCGAGLYDEKWLQKLIHNHPECLPIEEIEPGLERFESVCMELWTPRGYVDNLLMSPRGDIAVVETKLFRNPEARRLVLAQTLDYATCLFGMSYSEFKQAALRGDLGGRPRPASLYECLSEADKLPEAAFVDADSANLRRGRALLLIVGDGIRSDAEALLGGLHRHARFGFTLAFVELSIFSLPAPDKRLLVRSRTLAKTEIVQRTVIEMAFGGAVVSASEERLGVPETLSSEAYWAALEGKVPGARAAFERLIAAAEPLGVYPEFLNH